MVVQIEQARTNPSIGTLSKIGEALGVSLSDLVETGGAPLVRVVAPQDAAKLWQTPGGSNASLLVGGHRPDFIELWEWVLAPSETYEGHLHAQGIHELLHVLEGTLMLTVSGSVSLVEAGASASYAGDQPHSYFNDASETLRFILVMVDPTGARTV